MKRKKRADSLRRFLRLNNGAHGYADNEKKT